MWQKSLKSMAIALGLIGPAAAPAAEVPELLKSLQAVGPGGAGQQEAARAWAELARCDADALPAILAGFDGANPLAANWIATAVDAVVERAQQGGRKLPRDELAKFVLDVRHAPQSRRLAYELLAQIDPSAPQRLIAGMLDDPSLELRRDAIAQQIEAAEAAQQSGRRDEAIRLYQRCFDAARDLDQVQLLAGRLKKLGVAVDQPRHFGFLLRWHVIGPFDNTGEKGFDAAYPPEREIDLRRAYPGKAGEVRWIEHTASNAQGVVDLNKLFAPEKGVLAYATTEFVSGKKWQVQLRLTSENGVKLWLNGRLVDARPVYHSGFQFDQYVSRVELQPGRNVILVKVCQNELVEDWTKAWQFQLRVCDEIGTGVLPADAAQQTPSNKQ
jgi:tetratricopeptide (TPR) repeat protein